MTPPSQDEAQRLHEFFGRAASGFYAEVGVGRRSRTTLFEVAGWNGVLVEPQPDLAAFLVTVRSAKVFATACVAADQAGEPMPLRAPSPLAAIEVGRRPGLPAPGYVVMAPTRTLDDLLAEAEAPAPFDLLVLDIHGRELDALLGFDFERWRPRLIVIADPVVDLQRHRFLNESGYRAIRRDAGCGWYVPKDNAVSVERWPILRDYYLLMPFRKAWHALRRLNERMLAMAEK